MNPVLAKDLRGLLRLGRVAAIQMAFVIVLGLLLLVSWPQHGVVPLETRRNDSLLLGLIIGQLVLLICFVPGIAAVGITSEREQGTLEMLYASRLSVWQLVIGKLLGALSFPILLLISGLPYIGLLALRGEADLALLGTAYLVLLLSAVLLAMISLAVSAVCRQSSTALVAAYSAVFALGGATLVPAAIMLGSMGGGTARLLHALRSVSPVAAAMSLLRPGLSDFGGRADGIDALTGEVVVGFPPAWKWFVPFALMVIAVCVAVLVITLRRPPIVSDAPRAGKERSGRRTLAHRLLFLIDPNQPRKPIAGRNPLYAKEIRTNQLRSGRWMLRIFYAALFVSLALALMAMYGGQAQHGDLLRYVAMVLVAFQFGVILLIDPSLATPAVSAELESDTFELLRLSPLSAAQIFLGKFIPAAAPAMLAVVALLPAYGVVCFINPLYIKSFVLLLPLAGATALLCCATGMWFSSLTATTTRATVTNYLFTTAWVLLPLLAWMAGSGLLDQRVAALVAMPSPLAVGLNLLPGGAAEVASLWPLTLAGLLGVTSVALVLTWRRIGILLERGAG